MSGGAIISVHPDQRINTAYPRAEIPRWHWRMMQDLLSRGFTHCDYFRALEMESSDRCISIWMRCACGREEALSIRMAQVLGGPYDGIVESIVQWRKSNLAICASKP